MRHAMDTGATWVLWIDSDAAFVNLSASMEPLLDDRVDLILSHGGGSLMMDQHGRDPGAGHTLGTQLL